jgi:hypothetical protein
MTMSNPLLFHPDFEAAYQTWIQQQIRKSTGERKRRLASGLGYAEKMFLALVWVPAFGNFRNLHPEYEVKDFRDGARFLDFAYLASGLKVGIEIDPYGTHFRDIDRWKYDDNLVRHNDLVIDGWRLLRFSLDGMKERTRQCQSQLQQALGKWGLERSPAPEAEDPIDLAILRVMSAKAGPLAPIEVARELGWHRNTVAKHMSEMSRRGRLLPGHPGRRRNRAYRLHPDAQAYPSTPPKTN